ncbi:transcription repressor OFP8-like [Lolium rigidum]|uniref:transcription repressor OFP8-like n=1 Tax=Lolium rigidum TaxID=89674 RepID=UPI001F5C509A|nr:transcription repressor OFP8-like [Lolium rigidum]
MSTSSRARRGGGRQFAVGGRLRHVAVVDAGCGCRPRRPRLPALMSLPSFLRPAPKPPAPAPGSISSSSLSRSSSFFPSSASTASSATYSSSSASYKQHGQPPAVPYGVTAKASAPAPVARKKQATRKRREKAAASDEEGVGVAVEKESSDPRADFRDSMVQMVVEMGLCDWDGLRCMLRRLLALNAPRHHAAILAAFAEVCAQLASDPPPQPPAYHYDYYY